MKIYALYSKSKNRYYRPIFAEDLESAKSQIVDLVISTNDQVIVNSLDDLELRHLGVFNDNAFHHNPLIAAIDVEIQCDDLVRKLPFPPMVRDKIFKLYGIEVPGNPANIWAALDQCSLEVKSDAET